MGVGGQHHDPAAVPSVKTRLLLCKRLGWAPWTVRKGAEGLAPPGFDSRTVLAMSLLYDTKETRRINYRMTNS
jgi:hypothetical protein